MTFLSDSDLGPDPQFLRHLAAWGADARLFTARGFDTPEDVEAFFTQQPTRFDRVCDWLAEEASGPVVTHRDDLQGLLFVGLASVVDQVAFALTWSDHFSPPEEPSWTV